MTRLLADTKIGLKIIVPLIILAIVGLSGIAYTALQMKAVDDGYSEMYDTDTTALVATLRFNRAIQAIGYSAYIPMAYDGSSRQARDGQANYEQAVAQASQFLDAAVAAAPDWQDDVAPLRASLAAVVEAANSAVAQGMANDDGARANLTLMDAKLAELTTLTAAFNDEKMEVGAAENASRTKQTNAAILNVSLIVGLASLMAILASLWIASKGITAPLNSLRELMDKLANADFSVDVVGQDRKDEVGQMAKTVQVFKENGIRARDLDAEATRTRETNERERAIVAREQEKVVAQLADGLSRLSDGDLAFTLNERFGEEYEKLRSDFNAAMSKLKQTMQTVSGNTHGIRGGADEISQAADDLSRRTEQQAASLEETAAALDEITATVRTTAENANEARRVVAEASESAKHSGEVVGQAVEAMSKIEKSSQQISQIIGVIDEIAFQTNLLALNAGVEAARAGDAGRGFAVVASEVRALAQRSAEAAKEIKTLISASSVQVDQGVSLVAETGTALKGIVEQVAKINHLVADIAASAQEQATGLQQVNTAVNQMDQVTQQNAAMVEESTAASHSLAQETEQLSRLIGQFRTGDAAHEVVAMRKRPAAPQPAPQRSSQQTHTAMKTTGYGGAAPKSQHQPAEDGWEEF